MVQYNIINMLIDDIYFLFTIINPRIISGRVRIYATVERVVDNGVEESVASPLHPPKLPAHNDTRDSI